MMISLMISFPQFPEKWLPKQVESNLDVFQRNDPSGFLVGSVLEIVEAVVVEDEPAPLPRLVPSALLPQPALAVRIEERVHQIVAVVLRDLERLRFDAVVQALHQR